MPMTRDALPVSAASRVMEMEEVFEAKMASGARIRSSS